MLFNYHLGGAVSVGIFFCDIFYVNLSYCVILNIYGTFFLKWSPYAPQNCCGAKYLFESAKFAVPSSVFVN